MTEYDYLNPADIKAQCDAAIVRLERDNEALCTVENSLDTFIDDDEIKSVAYDALKQQISDYKTLLQAMREANNSDASDFAVLKASIGDEILDGACILTQKQTALQARKYDEGMAQGYERDSWTAEYPWLSWYYGWKANQYWQMAEIDQQLYNAWQAKEEAFDAIEASTNGLFRSSMQLRQAAQRGLESITSAFQNGTYKPNMSAEWRNTFTDDYRKEWYAQELRNLGYKQEEIDILITKGIVLTGTDIGKIKETLLTEKIYVSSDCKALFYHGKVYYIDVPTAANKKVAYEPVWVTDEVIQQTKMQFDWAEGILEIELEDIPKEEIRTRNNAYVLQETYISSKVPNATAVTNLHILMGVGGFLEAALKHTEVNINFESAGDARRVVISVGDSKTRQKFDAINYNIPINTYREQDGVMGYIYASDMAESIYKGVTGEEAPVTDGAYTITGTLDERHNETSISGYLSYNATGELIYTPLVFSGDTACIAICDKITGYNTNVILDVTELLAMPETVDQVTKNIFEKALEEQIDASK